MNRIALVNKVRTLLDEISSENMPIVDVGMVDNNPLDEIIDSLLDESAVEILMKAPFHRLDISSATVTPEQNFNDKTIGKFALPEDFLRLVYFTMSDWLRPVTELAIKGDPVSQRQSIKYIRGGLARPVGVLVKDDGGLKIEYYSTRVERHEVSEFKYIARTTAEYISDEMVDAMCWICAGKTLVVMGQPEQAKNAYDNAQSLMV